MSNEAVYKKNEIGRYYFACERNPNMPEQLEGKAIMVSGHFGVRYIDGDRIINDRSGGNSEKPIEAFILPERTIIKSWG